MATNHDPTFPTPEGLVPGAGAIVASIEVATGVAAQVCGKPHEPMVDLVHHLVGVDGVVVGDRADTDGAFAEALGFGFALVFSGATSPADLPVEPAPRHTADDLSSLVDAMGIAPGGLTVPARPCRLDDVSMPSSCVASSSPTRSQARELIDRHRVQVNGAFADKAAASGVEPAMPSRWWGSRPRFVGRGGEKLAGALAAFGVDPTGWRCLDAGASTGGFTDCLLQSGAASVVAIDVGYGQLHESLVASAAVDNRERTNIRDVVPDDVGWTGRPGGRRSVVHLAADGDARAGGPRRRAWCADLVGQTAVRGRPARGRTRARRHP